MKVGELGEFGLIELVRGIVAGHGHPEQPPWREVLVGIGDDAAAWQGNDRTQLATTDTLVEGVHFDPDVISWQELGWKALAINLSDIAAMGGVPAYALLSLALPGDLEVEAVSRFSSAMAQAAGEYGVAIVGGNMAASTRVVITITLMGYLKGQEMLKRSTALPRQRIAVTGYPGLSAAGLEMLKGRAVSQRETADLLRRAHLTPTPRVREGQALVAAGVRTAIDISDGLIADLAHICEASTVNAEVRVEAVPAHPLLAAAFDNYRELALCGGEDYELMFTADEATIARAGQALDCPVTVIGTITEGPSPTRVTVLDRDGKSISFRKGGWEHFRDGVSGVRHAQS